MHELSIAQNIAKIVLSETERLKITKPVQKIVFCAGRMNAIIPESLRANFEIIKREHPVIAKAALEIREIPVKAMCTSCAFEFELEEPVFICPKCGCMARPLDPASCGNDMFVESIETKD
ncbi:MAG: hypothetical protein A2583_05995 [Bdellovibrionales bacterium RIFOXYD1_FULL_53_11]|nr:MAG: hypothetical protein A2583_05995 [Bdellovibrionales bacterium RIFOXYD1_FULL_53_11]